MPVEPAAPTAPPDAVLPAHEQVAIARLVYEREASRLRPDARTSRRYGHRPGAGLAVGLVISVLVALVLVLEALVVAQRAHDAHDASSAPGIARGAPAGAAVSALRVSGVGVRA